MSIFSLDWFKSQKTKEKEELQIEVLKLQKEALIKSSIIQLPKPEKVCRKIKLVNDQLTIVLNNGDVLTKTGATQQDFMKARAATYEEELFLIVKPDENIMERTKKEQEIIKVKELLEGIEILKEHTDFEVKEDSVYLKDTNGVTINRSIPQLLVEKFIEIISRPVSSKDYEEMYANEYHALKKFWLKCCLNPNAQSAEDLYKFLAKHQFKIDQHGNFYAYRRVVSITEGGNKKLVDFISNTYNKVKGVWKKKPENYSIYSRLGEYTIIDLKKNNIPKEDNPFWEEVGNLEKLYIDLPNMQKGMFTSAHTGEEDYRVGDIISMPRDKGDDNNNISCSHGFHAASKAYDYSGFGDTPILVIINPMDVLAVPLNEDGKLRTCRWFFAMTLTDTEQFILDDKDFDTMELGDIFEEKCSIDLQGYVQNSFAEEVKRHTFTIPHISAGEINTIIHSLDEMKALLDKRVVEVD